jgi:hypothetical protein
MTRPENALARLMCAQDRSLRCWHSVPAAERGWRAVTYELVENHSPDKAREVIAASARRAQERTTRAVTGSQEPGTDAELGPEAELGAGL